MGFYESALFEKLEKKYKLGMFSIALFFVLSCGGNVPMLLSGVGIFVLAQLHDVKSLGGK